MARCRELDGEGVVASVVSEHGDPAEAEPVPSSELDRRREPGNLCKVVVVVHVLEVLAGDLDLVELSVVELGQVAVALVERLLPRPSVEHGLVPVPPLLQLAHIVAQVRLLHEVVLEPFL